VARKPSPGANLGKIAAALDVSVSTASRALRNADGIHPETRRMVLQKAGEMGYVMPGLQGPDINARPHQILALATEVAPGTDLGFLTGMSRSSIAMNLAVLSHHVKPEDCRSVLELENQPVAMRAGLVDGVVLIHFWPDDVAAAISRRFPTVSIVHSYAGAEIDIVGRDDRAGMSLLVDHLLAGDHRRIGYFGFCQDVSWSSARFAAYVEALRSRGLPYHPKDSVDISKEQALAYRDFGPEGWGNNVLARIKQGVDAWICPSSGTASALLDFLLVKGVKVPRDVAVASCSGRFDRPEMPTMTMLEVPSEDLGAAALRRLVNRLQTPREMTRSVLLPSELFVGQTTRSVRRNRLR
jgi:LacI family transcriptional regulator